MLPWGTPWDRERLPDKDQHDEVLLKKKRTSHAL